MVRVLRLVLVLCLAGGFPALKSHGEQKDKPNDLMRKKLQHSQKVLEGIALGDFKLIARQADELISVSKTAEWKALNTPKYEIYSNEFRRSAENLIKNAKDKNIDGATLAYVELTMNCVKCHKHVREVRMTRLAPPDPANARQAVKHSGD